MSVPTSRSLVPVVPNELRLNVVPAKLLVKFIVAVALGYI
jgi:hypothetical protein